MKALVAALLLILGVSYIPGMFIPAGPVGDVFMVVVQAPDRLFGVVKDADERVADGVADRRGTRVGESTPAGCALSLTRLLFPWIAPA